MDGFRNAQATVIAPTGTIGLLMDCDTTGIEPDYALVKFKKLAGGGYFRIINNSVPLALRRLGYNENQIEQIVTWCRGTGTLVDAPHINNESLAALGFTPEIGIDIAPLHSRYNSIDKLTCPPLVFGIYIFPFRFPDPLHNYLFSYLRRDPAGVFRYHRELDSGVHGRLKAYAGEAETLSFHSRTGSTPPAFTD